MWGGMTAVAVRHDRRKGKNKPDKGQRPTKLLLKPGGGGGADSPGKVSAAPSRAGSPTQETQPAASLAFAVRYGDECFYNKVSLLHFIVFFLLGGLTLLVVGAVQFKREAGLAHLKHQFLTAGAILLAVGIVLIVVKCACFRTPIYEGEDEEACNDKGKPLGSKLPSPVNSPGKFTQPKNGSGSAGPLPPPPRLSITPASVASSSVGSMSTAAANRIESPSGQAPVDAAAAAAGSSCSSPVAVSDQVQALTSGANNRKTQHPQQQSSNSKKQSEFPLNPV